MSPALEECMVRRGEGTHWLSSSFRLADREHLSTATCRRRGVRTSSGTRRCRPSTTSSARFARRRGATPRSCWATSTRTWRAMTAPRPCPSPRWRCTRAWSAAKCLGTRAFGGTLAAATTSAARSTKPSCRWAGGKRSWEKLCGGPPPVRGHPFGTSSTAMAPAIRRPPLPLAHKSADAHNME